MGLIYIYIYIIYIYIYIDMVYLCLMRSSHSSYDILCSKSPRWLMILSGFSYDDVEPRCVIIMNMMWKYVEIPFLTSLVFNAISGFEHCSCLMSRNLSPIWDRGFYPLGLMSGRNDAQLWWTTFLLTLQNL